MNYFVKFFVLIVIVLIVFSTGVYYHEVRHQQIFSDFGVDSSIRFDLVGAYTVPVNSVVLVVDDINLMDGYHNDNDNVAYNLVIIEMFLALIFVLLSFKILLVGEVRI